MKSLNISGKDIGLKYGHFAIKGVLNLVGGKSIKDLSKVEELQIDKIPDFILLGIENASLVEESKFNTTKEEIQKELDANFGLFFEALEIFGQDVAPSSKIDAEGN